MSAETSTQTTSEQSDETTDEIACTVCNDCDNCQTLCERGSQVYSERCGNTFSFKECVSSGELFFSLDTWNKAFKYIYAAYSLGSDTNNLRNAPDEDDNDFMTAKKYNEVAKLINVKTRNSGDVIYGTYFEEIEEKLSDLELSSRQCNRCNSGCDTCDAETYKTKCPATCTTSCSTSCSTTCPDPPSNSSS